MEQKHQSIPAPLEGERRHLTVLFCDMVSSTTLGQELQLDDLHSLYHEYRRTCSEVIDSFDGHVAQWLGDGMLVYFGYPRAHGDDAERATRAALAILEAIDAWNSQPEQKSAEISVRIGVHSGHVLVGETAGDEPGHGLAVGHTVNLAARLQAIAEPGTVVTSRETLRLIQGRFVTKECGEFSFRGVNRPISVYRVVRPRAVHSPIWDVPEENLTPLVGREQELGLLADRIEQTKYGIGQAVLIRGEEGIGKTRLLRAFRNLLSDSPHAWFECSCSPYRESSAFYPLIQFLEQGLGLANGDTPEKKLELLEERLTDAGVSLPDVVPSLAELLSVPLPDHYVVGSLSPDARRHKIYEALVSWVFTVCREQPVVFVVEDLQWIDPSSLDFIGTMVDQCPTVPLLVILTHRPSYDPPWAKRSSLVQLTLNQLTRTQVSKMVHRIPQAGDLAVEAVDQIVKAADGIPFFAEELTRNLLESEHQRPLRSHEVPGTVWDPTIPSRLYDLLMARLDRLDSAKEIAQLASVLGRDFSHDLLASVASIDEASLMQELDALLRAEILYRHGSPPRATYSFRHALLQQVAYQSLLRGQREQLHRRVAEAQEARKPEVREVEPEWLARHYERAGLDEKALAYYRMAGAVAMKRSTHVEAVGHLGRAIALLKAIPDLEERTRLELALHMELGAHLMASNGYADSATEDAYARARELCGSVGETDALARSLSGLAAFYQVRGELNDALQIGKQLLDVGESEGNPRVIVWGHLAMGSPLLWQGDFPRAVRHFERTWKLYDTLEERFAERTQDPGVLSRSHGALALWLLGRVDDALETSSEAIRIARELGDPFNLATALAFGGILSQWHREPHAASKLADEVIKLSEEQCFPLWKGTGLVVRGWALADRRPKGDGVDYLNQGLTELARTGTAVGRPAVLGLLAEVNRRLGDLTAASQAVTSALEFAECNGVRFWDAELKRIEGELALRGSNDEPEAEACFRRALEISSRQSAKPFELRAATSLARLQLRQGKSREARELLSHALSSMKQGSGSPDVREARELLGRL